MKFNVIDASENQTFELKDLSDEEVDIHGETAGWHLTRAKIIRRAWQTQDSKLDSTNNVLSIFHKYKDRRPTIHIDMNRLYIGKPRNGSYEDEKGNESQLYFRRTRDKEFWKEYSYAFAYDTVDVLNGKKVLGGFMIARMLESPDQTTKIINWFVLPEDGNRRQRLIYKKTKSKPIRNQKNQLKEISEYAGMSQEWHVGGMILDQKKGHSLYRRRYMLTSNRNNVLYFAGKERRKFVKPMDSFRQFREKLPHYWNAETSETKNEYTSLKAKLISKCEFEDDE